MNKFLATVAVLCILGKAQAQMDCSDREDGPHGQGCKSYTCCQGGQGVQIDCEYGCVYNDERGGCDLPSNVGPPCGEIEDCSGLPDGSYPDMSTDCEWYYTCIGGSDVGKQQCVGGLVFSYYYQQCMWIQNVYPPCGTKPLPTEIPPEYTLPSFITLPPDSYPDNPCDDFFCPRPNSTFVTTSSP